MHFKLLPNASARLLDWTSELAVVTKAKMARVAERLEPSRMICYFKFHNDRYFLEENANGILS